MFYKRDRVAPLEADPQKVRVPLTLGFPTLVILLGPFDGYNVRVSTHLLSYNF